MTKSFYHGNFETLRTLFEAGCAALFEGHAALRNPIILGADRRLKTRSGKRPLQVARLDCSHLKEK